MGPSPAHVAVTILAMLLIYRNLWLEEKLFHVMLTVHKGSKSLLSVGQFGASVSKIWF